jgi:hypothetical protein
MFDHGDIVGSRGRGGSDGRSRRRRNILVGAGCRVRKSGGDTRGIRIVFGICGGLGCIR